MNKYINADRLCEDLMTRWEIADKEKEKEIQSIMADIVTPIVVGQPSADVVEVKHGEWIKTNPLTDTFECSLCGMQIPVPELRSPFCPLCGADMRERKGED